MPPRQINEIVHGTRRITAHTALRLARYFGTSDELALSLKIPYRTLRVNHTERTPDGLGRDRRDSSSTSALQPSGSFEESLSQLAESPWAPTASVLTRGWPARRSFIRTAPGAAEWDEADKETAAGSVRAPPPVLLVVRLPERATLDVSVPAILWIYGA